MISFFKDFVGSHRKLVILSVSQVVAGAPAGVAFVATLTAVERSTDSGWAR
jgi:hypothetical protein